MHNIENILSRFNKLSLEEMNSVKLMNRVDVKYVLHYNDLEKILETLSLDYEILEVNNSLNSNYETSYFDTGNYEMYNIHHNGKANRHKVRTRTYKDSNVSFVEVKYKNNKKKTAKTRILRENNTIEFSKKEKKFITDKSPYNPETLKTALNNHFKRITLVNRKDVERVTIDTDITFIKDDNKIKMDNMVICEIKKLPHNYLSIMEYALRKHHIKVFRISKYCLGSYLCNPDVKLNLFKEKYRYINKIITR